MLEKIVLGDHSRKLIYLNQLLIKVDRWSMEFYIYIYIYNSETYHKYKDVISHRLRKIK